MNDEPGLVQKSPYPQILEDLINACEYRPGWRIRLQHMKRDAKGLEEGLTLIITTLGYDSYHPKAGETYRVNHYFPVPPATYNYKSWRHWLLDQFLLVEKHEACEFFKISGKRPYAPHHGPGNDPYLIFERGTDEEARTMYTGEIKPPVKI